MSISILSLVSSKNGETLTILLCPWKCNKFKGEEWSLYEKNKLPLVEAPPAGYKPPQKHPSSFGLSRLNATQTEHHSLTRPALIKYFKLSNAL